MGERRLTPELAQRHKIIKAGRNSGDCSVDVTSKDPIKRLFEQVKNIDACICIAASGPLDDFQTLTEEKLLSAALELSNVCIRYNYEQGSINTGQMKCCSFCIYN
jgi:hypothetical protein